VIADIMRGSGRYNLAQGAIATMVGIGASLSGIAAGEIVDHFGYSAAFLALGASATLAAIVFGVAMPETAEFAKPTPGPPPNSAAAPAPSGLAE
jgi:MFS family permease